MTCIFFFLACASDASVIESSEKTMGSTPTATVSSAIPDKDQPAMPDKDHPVHADEVSEDTSNDCSEVLVLPSLERGAKVMLIGDSLAVGMSREFKRIAKIAGYVPVTHAKVGSSTRQWLKWIKDDLRIHKPKLVVVSLGTNDAAGYRMIERDPEMHRKLVDLILEADAFVVWIGPPSIKETRVPKIEKVRKIIKEAAPIYYPSEDLDIRLEDGIHTNAEGYSRWARSVWHQISSMMITFDFE